MLLRVPSLAYRSNDRVLLVWETDEPSDSYVAFYQNGQLIAETSNGRLVRVHRMPVPNLSPGTTYDFYVESRDPAGNLVAYPPEGRPLARAARGAGGRGGASVTTATQADNTYPVIVSQPVVQARTGRTLTIKWETDETSNSVVYYGADAAGKVGAGAAEEGLTRSTSQGDNVRNHVVTLTGLDTGTRYSFRVASTDPSGNGETLSNLITVETSAGEDYTAPQIIDGPTVVGQTDSRLTVRWVTDEPADSKVFFGPAGSGKPAAGEEVPDVAVPDLVTEHLVTLTNLTASSSYDIEVQSADLNGNESTKSSVSGTTLGEPDETGPRFTAGPNVTVDASQVYVTWQTDEPSNSEVQFGLQPTFGQIANKSELGTQHSVAITGLAAATEYYFKIASTDASGNASDSTNSALKWTTLAAPDTVAPAKVSGVEKLIGAYAVRLTWAASPDSDLAGYKVMRSADGGAYSEIARLITSTTFTDPGVEPGKAYRYLVYAQDNSAAANVSVPSDTVLASPTSADAPGAPAVAVTEDQQGNLHAPGQPFLHVTNAAPGTRATESYTFVLSKNLDLSAPVAVVNNVPEGSDTTRWRVNFRLDHLETYYWAAQAVDNEGFSGPFSEPKSFIADTMLHPVSIELSSFTAVAQRQVVQLGWGISEDSESAVFHVWRSIGEDGEFERLTNAAIANPSGSYQYWDVDVTPGVTYSYKVEAFNRLGHRKLVGPVSITAATPMETAINQNVPNPFNPTTMIAYQVPVAADVRLVIYNTLGQEVRTLVNDRVTAGYYQVTWDGRTGLGAEAGSGVYFARLFVTPTHESANAETRVIRMLMVK